MDGQVVNAGPHQPEERLRVNNPIAGAPSPSCNTAAAARNEIPPSRLELKPPNWAWNPTVSNASQRFSRDGIPKPDHTGPIARGEKLTVRAKAQCFNHRLVAIADGDQIARYCVPAFDASVFGDGCKPPAIGTEGHRGHTALMSFQILLLRRVRDGPGA
jgi:hypothetical protein